MTLIERMIELEKAEIGYKERSDGWTKFGQWYADNIAHSQSFAVADWCAMFQTWAAAMAGIPATDWPYISPQGSAVNYMANWFESKGFRTPADDMPQIGDIILYSWSYDDDDLDHVGICSAVIGDVPDYAIMHVIEGNYNNSVMVRNIRYRDDSVRKTFRLPSANQEYFPELSFLLSRGSSGPAVEILQAGLICRGYDILGGVDGYFGPETEAALNRYQTDSEIEVDGKAGTETFASMLRGF